MHTGRVLAYGALGLPLAFAALPIYVHLPGFYAATTGLSLAWLGAVLLIARLFDAAIDPVCGWLADRIAQPRLIAWSLPVFALGFVALLNPQGSAPALWLLASLGVTYLGFSLASVAYQAWGAGMVADSALRTRLTAAREGFGLLGVVLAAALPALIAADTQQGVQRLSWLLPPLLLIAAGVALGWGRPDRPSQRVAGKVPLGLRAGVVALLALPAFRRLLLIFVANGIASALPATLFLFFVADRLGAEPASGPLLALYFLAGAASMPGWLRLSRALGRPRAWLLAMGLAMLAFAGAGLLGEGDVWPFALICLMSGLALGADLALPAAMAADLGERQGLAGTCFGLWNFVGKLNLALAAGLALPLVGLLGYAPGGTSGLPALVFAYAILPLAFKAVAATLLWRWRHSLEIES